MKISTKGQYALKLMLDLAIHNTGEYISLKDISNRQKISIKYLEQIVSQLTHARLLKSVRGPQGGYQLARSPIEYTVKDILQVTEGDIIPIAQNSATIDVATTEFWAGLSKCISNYLSNTTLEQLANKEREYYGSDYSI